MLIKIKKSIKYIKKEKGINMFSKFFLSKRLHKIFKVVEFKGLNPSSKLYGTFKVKVSDEDGCFVYQFIDCKLTKDKKTGEICLFQRNVKQISASFFWIKLFNDPQILTILLDRIDKNIYYYVE